MGPAQGAPGDEVEGHQFHGAVGFAAGGTVIEQGARPFEDERLQEERRRDQRLLGLVLGEGPGRRRAS